MVRLCDNNTQYNQSMVNLTANQNYKYLSCPCMAKIYSDGWRGENTNEYLTVKN